MKILNILCTLCVLCGSAAAAEKPNILIIVSDDHGYADAGFQGGKEAVTPHLDALAKSGVRCTSGYVTYPVCSPSRAGLLTGRYQARFGHENNPVYDPLDANEGLPLTEKLLPQFLKGAGYRTGWIGKWHLGSSPAHVPWARGFDESFGFIGGGHRFTGWQPNERQYTLPLIRSGKASNYEGGLTGGGIFGVWMSDTEIWNNRFLDGRTLPHEHYYGIKGREARRVRIHHNTIEAGFSIELPFEGDEDVEIDHNILRAAVSIPKYAGGPVPKSGRTFHIHHNYFTDGYSIEFVRNGVEIDHNLFDFDAAKDGGNLVAAFGDVPAKGPAKFHNKLVNNSGRGVMWMNEPYANLEVRNNHIIARTTTTPRTEGLFGFNEKSDFKTFHFTGNIIECIGTARPLFRNDASGTALVENNQLANVSDTTRYANKQTGAPHGLEQPLKFACGVNGELTVDGWKTSKSPAK